LEDFFIDVGCSDADDSALMSAIQRKFARVFLAVKTKASKTAPISLDYPACPASLDTFKVSVPPAVKLAAVFSVRPTLDPDIIAAEIVEDLEAALQQFAAIAADLKR